VATLYLTYLLSLPYQFMDAGRTLRDGLDLTLPLGRRRQHISQNMGAGGPSAVGRRMPVFYIVFIVRVVQTHRTTTVLPQLTYYPPHIATHVLRCRTTQHRARWHALHATYRARTLPSPATTHTRGALPRLTVSWPSGWTTISWRCYGTFVLDGSLAVGAVNHASRHMPASDLPAPHHTAFGAGLR